MRSRWFLLALAAVLFLTGPALAGQKAGKITLSPMLGGVVFEGDQNVEDELAYSLGLGYNLTRALGLEAVLSGSSTESDEAGSKDVDLVTYRLDALYHLLPDAALVPYLALGLGNYSLDSDNEFMVNYGVGVKYFFAENVALRGDVRHLLVADESNLDHNLLYTAGLLFQFAEPAAAPKPAPAPAAPAPRPAPVAAAPADSDGDGVPDDRDKCPDTRKGEFVDEDGCTLKLTLHINFDFDRAEIKPEFKPDLEKAARFIQKYQEVPYILIEGHTDWIGDADYNQKLSERRAAAVRNYLIENYGIAAKRLVSRGYGEARPVASNDTEEGRYENRRVEVICCVIIPSE